MLLTILTTTSLALAAAEVGQPAPAFTLTDLAGRQVSLSELAGKTVVLEWFNPDCPFVVYAYGEGPLGAPKRAAAITGAKVEDVVWLRINSGAPGQQGHGVARNARAVQDWSIAGPVLLDESGVVGKAYGAKTTPHIFVVGPDQKVAYVGGLDNAPRGRVEDGSAYQYYTAMALGALASGQTPDPASTRPYGCSVKYGS